MKLSLIKAISLTCCLALFSACRGSVSAFRSKYDEGRSKINAAISYINEEKYEQAITELNIIIEKRLPEEFQTRAYWYLGKCYKDMGKFDKALSIYQVANQLYPEYPPFMYALGDLYYRADMLDKAQTIFSSLLEIESDSFEGNVGLARTYDKQGFLSKAAQRYKTALDSIIVRDYALWRDYGDCLYRQKNYMEAESAVNKSISQSPNNADSWLLLAKIQNNKGNLSEAYYSFEKACALAPKRNDIKLERALWLISQNRLTVALDIAQSVLDASPEDALAVFTKAIALVRLGKNKEAAFYFQKLAGDEKNPFLAAVAERFIAENSNQR